MNVDNPFKSPSVISFCPGILGLERGMEQALRAKLRVAAYSEIEAFAIENIMQGMEQGILDPAPLWTDVRTFPAHYFRGKVHGLLAGYSCQPFSNAGKRKGDEDPRHLWPYIYEHTRVIRPLFCGFENVDGHLSLGFDEVLYSLRELGYKVEAGLYSAAETGAPQERARLFILAISPELADAKSIRYIHGSPEIISDKRREHALGDAATSDKNELGDSQGIGVEGHRTEGQQESETHAAEAVSLRSGGGRKYVARPGQKQHDWEEPRSVKSILDSSATRNKLEIDILLLDYENKKRRTCEKLYLLWDFIEKKAFQWETGRLFDFLKKEFLFNELLSKTTPQCLLIYIVEQEKSTSYAEESLRNVRSNPKSSNSSQRRESIKQLRRKFTDAMWELSYQIALANRKETSGEKLYKEVFGLWDSYKDTQWYVPETLSEIQKIWRPEFNENKNKRIFISACSCFGLELHIAGSYNYREDFLRALGNSVYSDTAELAFKDLFKKHGINI